MNIYKYITYIKISVSSIFFKIESTHKIPLLELLMFPITTELQIQLSIIARDKYKYFRM